MSCVDAYCRRLRIDERPIEPTIETLQLLTERHLQYIPFENISMHLVSEDDAPVVLEREKLLHKILTQQRGGCCLELNGAYAILLQELGYRVQFISCWVYAGAERGHASKKAKFRVQQTHFVLLVQPPNDDTVKYLVDVGLGEPPCHPLPYILNQETVTPDGMQSRIVEDPRGSWKDGSGRERKCHILEWFKNNGWEPRLQWDACDAVFDKDHIDVSSSLLCYQYVVPILTHPKSTFSRKLIVCLLNRNEKLSLSGWTLKRTSPRFVNSVITTESVESQDELKQILRDEYGMDISWLSDLTVNRSNDHHAGKIWDHL
ncbi:arylamine N-acetyltransferase [Fistulifera solaris]|jgi:arylamine N-acetyltransferase|uniref:Arylamine N-acetyltransferase n=1 Tax=Fistulifera solaris TaxID=1519565 RepID=A0A1Z5K2A8_FISSO|nr:arylamine N-acetyltransferase [Fistulifera solaris]|eukprot:GAX20256.1 arylamine N-acetyltransferase [Fistulifera solaris]